MEFKVRSFGGIYREISVDEISTSTLNAIESAELALKMINAADELLYGGSCGRLDDTFDSLRTEIETDIAEHKYDAAWSS
jgi:hypothetical protein